MKASPNDRLVSRIRSMSRVDAQNSLMCISDRAIAMAMMYMQDIDRSSIFALLSQAKSGRVREELDLHQRLNIKYSDYLRAVENLLNSLSSTRTTVFKSYLRPVKNRRSSGYSNQGK